METITKLEGYPKSVPFDSTDFPNEHKPTVLFAGIYAPTFDSGFMVKGFEKAGYNVVTIDWQKVKLTEQVFGLRERLIVSAMMHQPDFIFLHIQSEAILDKPTVEKLQSIAPTVLYNFDCRSFEKTQWIYDLAPYLELVLFSNLEDVKRCELLGINNTAVMSSSADYEHYRKGNISVEQKEKYPHDIVFIGNRFDNTNMGFDNAAERIKMVEFLSSWYGDRFFAYGMGFSRLVNQQEEVLIYNSAKIAITQNNFVRTNYCSDRIYRAMGCGIMAVQQYYPGINKDFIPQVTSTWLNFDMLKDEINKHLEDETLRYAKAKAGAEYVRENHSWYNRVLQLQELLKLQQTKKAAL
jgi:hypothetical protein